MKEVSVYKELRDRFHHVPSGFEAMVKSMIKDLNDDFINGFDLKVIFTQWKKQKLSQVIEVDAFIDLAIDYLKMDIKVEIRGFLDSVNYKYNHSQEIINDYLEEIRKKSTLLNELKKEIKK